MTPTTDGNQVKLVADVAPIAQERVLLVRYTDTNTYDHQPGWFLPDDLIAFREHPEEAARRILRAQTGIADAAVWLSHVESFTGRDGTWHLVFHCVAELPAAAIVAPGAGVATAEWFPLDALPPRDEVAHHGWALDTIRELARTTPAQPALRG